MIIRCDGSTIDHPSPWAGKLTPDLNTERRFLRGGHDSDQLKLEDDSIKSHDHSTKDTFFWPYPSPSCPTGSHQVNIWGIDSNHNQDDRRCEEDFSTGSTGNEETKPKNMNVIFIIRVF